jgi:DNA (cytosine-5)-methyltransferase 1
MAGGLGGGNCSQYWIENDNKTMTAPSNNKPPYLVPSMADIRALPWNGFNAISTFSGCGGSSTGYRMAGFKILWASEFIDAARDSYNANKAPYTIVDGRDIRNVTAAEILSAINMKPGELDLFDGSPPCASFSTAGKREAGWGKVKKYSDKAQRTDDLFFEYVRLLKDLQPKTFVAENVSGLVKGTAKGYFIEIIKALKACGYRVTCKVLDAQWLGVPQSRQRTIFVGVREDLGLDPVHPKPLAYRYTVRDALPWIVGINGAMPTIQAGAGASPSSGFNHGTCIVESETDISHYAIGAEWDKLKPGEQSDRFFSLVKLNPDKVSPCVQASHGNTSTAGITHPTEKRKFTIAELKRICAFPDDFILTGTYAQQWERCGRAVPPVMMSHIAAAIRDQILAKL